jgi:hypothetical protein
MKYKLKICTLSIIFLGRISGSIDLGEYVSRMGGMPDAYTLGKETLGRRRYKL